MGDPAAVVRVFACECGDGSCEADIDLAVGAFGDGPLLAYGHG